MLWMLGIAAIIVDVVSRFTTTSPPPVKVVIQTTAAPDVDLTYIIIDEKRPLSSVMGIEDNTIFEGEGEEEGSFPADVLVDKRGSSHNKTKANIYNWGKQKEDLKKVVKAQANSTTKGPDVNT